MKLIVGLGNPGDEYLWTRHNTGFLALDFYFKRYDLSWRVKPRLGAFSGRRGDLLFIKPQEFYNLSGQAVTAYQRYYKIEVSDILVICDDFCLDFGKLRYRAKGSAGGNNGLKSVIASLGTEVVPRLRMGTGNDSLRRKLGDVEFVLSRFTPKEKEQLPGILMEICEKIDEFGEK